MILNHTDPQVEQKLRSESAANAAVEAICAAVDACPDAFEVDPGASGLEFRFGASRGDAGQQRARMKVFSPRAGHTLIFFYKKSLVPYSRDRYSYGGIELRTAQVDATHVAEWLSFLSSGFHPEKRPAQLRRAFPYEIPE